MIRILGVSLWIWGAGFVVLAAGTFGLLSMGGGKPDEIEFVKKELWTSGGEFEVRGQIHNPRKTAARGVRLEFEIYKERMSRTGMPERQRLGKASDTLEYIPAGSTVDFRAASRISTQCVGRYELAGFDGGIKGEGYPK